MAEITLESLSAKIDEMQKVIDTQADGIVETNKKLDEQEMQIDDAFKKLVAIQNGSVAILTEAPKAPELPKLPADSTFELEDKKYKLLIPQYSVPQFDEEEKPSGHKLFTAEELLAKTGKGNLKNEKQLKTLVAGKNRYIVEVK